jgi:hypothetical protein
MIRPAALLTITVALGALGAALLGGCGSTTKTVSVSAAPTPSIASTATGASSTATSTSSSGATGPSTGGVAPTTTRTATAPAFTHVEGGAPGSGAAAAIVRAHGYTPNDTSDYHPNQTLRVLIGTRTGSGDGYGQQAFFFIDGRYIGTDTSQPSAAVKVLSQSDTEVTLAYPLYRAHDALCCPSGGHANVRFQLNNGRLTPLDAIPPASSAQGMSRQ